MIILMKKEAGGLVSEACVSYFMGPQETDLNDRVYMEPLAEIVGSAMKAIGNMDVRKELLYALGEPMNLEGDQAISVMKKPENLLYVNSFLSSLNGLSLAGKMVFSTMAGENAYTDVSKLDPEKADSYPPVYAELLKNLDPETMKNYKAADHTLTALSGESSWNQAVAGYMRGEYSMKNPKQFQMMETEALTDWVISSYMREKIADYGKAAAIPQAADMAEIANMDSWQHRLLGRHVGEAVKNKKLSMAEQMTAASAPGESRQWVAGILSEMHEVRMEKNRGALARVKVDLSEMERAGRPEKKKSLSEATKTHSVPKKERTLKP